MSFYFQNQQEELGATVKTLWQYMYENPAEPLK